MNYLRSLVIWSFFLGVFLSACSERPSEGVSRAQQSIDNRDFTTAIIELKSLLQRHPDIVRARWLLGVAYLEIEDGASAEKELRRAHALGIDAESVLPLVARSLIYQRNFEDVLALDAQGPFSGSVRGELAAYKTLALLGLNELNAALASISAALDYAPQLPWVQFAHARVLIATGDQEAAVSVLTSLLESDEENGRAWSLLGDLYFFRDELELAQSAYESATRLRAHDLRDRIQLVQVLLRRGVVKEAAANLDLMLKEEANSPSVSAIAGLVRFEQKRYEDAVEFLEAAYSKDSGDYRTVLILALSHYLTGNIERAFLLGEQAMGIRPNSRSAANVVAATSLKIGRPERAEEAIKAAYGSQPLEPESKKLLASSLLAQGKAADAAPLMQQIADVSESPLAYAEAGLTLLAAGRIDESLATLRDAHKMAPNDVAISRLVIAGLLEAEFGGEAVIRARELTIEQPENPLAWNLLGMSQIDQGETTSAKEAFSKALLLDPGNESALLNLANLAMQSGALNSAEDYLKQGLSKKPNHAEMLYRYALLVRARGDRQESIELLRRSLEQSPNLFAARLLLAHDLLEQGSAREVVGLFDLSVQGKNDDVAQALVAQGLIDLGRFPEARVLLARLAARTPTSVAIQLALASVCEKLGELECVAVALDDAMVNAPHDDRLILAKVRLEASMGNLAQARGLIAQVGGDLQNVEYLETRALLSRLTGDVGSEIRFARLLFDAKPALGTLMPLVSAYIRAGDRNLAEEYLRGWIGKYPDSVEALLVLADIEFEKGNATESVKHLRSVLRAEPKNLIALNNLALSLTESEPQLARQFAEDAVNLAPLSPTLIDTYASVFIATRGTREQALALFDQPDASLQTKRQLMLREAAVLHRLGDSAGAQSRVDRLLEVLPGDNKLRQAAVALRESWLSPLAPNETD